MNEEIRENIEDENLEATEEIAETEKEGFNPLSAVIGGLALVGAGVAVKGVMKLGKKGFNAAKQKIQNFKEKHPKKEKVEVIEVKTVEPEETNEE